MRPSTKSDPADPVVFWFRVGKVQLARFPEVGVPRIGVTSVGEVANTSEPVPVSSVTAPLKLVLDGVAKNVATPVPKPLTPDAIGRPVQLVKTPAEGVPKAGVVKLGEFSGASCWVAALIWQKKPADVVHISPLIGELGAVPCGATKLPRVVLLALPVIRSVAVRYWKVAVPVSAGESENTKAPVPVSPVTAAARFALDGVAKKAAIPAASPLIPVETGNPVQFVKTPLVGVPSSGVTSVGDVANTKLPVPVSSVTAALKLVLDGVARKVATPVPSPLTPDAMGSPVQFVSTPDVGVPSKGVTSVGDVDRTASPEPVDVPTPVPPFATGRIPVTPVVSGSPVALVRTKAEGVPKDPPGAR
jgi:hypothetical protein